MFIDYSSSAQTQTATTSTLTLPNFAGISFTHPALTSGPTSGHPVYPTVPLGAPYSVEWDYDGSTYGKFVITLSDRTKWVFGGSVRVYQTPSSTQDVDLGLTQIIDRNGNAITLNYSPPYVTAGPLLNSITDSQGTALLTIGRSSTAPFAIVSVTDRYSRTVYYNEAPLGSYNAGYLTQVSQIVPSSTSSATALASDLRYTYGYVEDTDAGLDLQTITVPSATGSGTATTTLAYPSPNGPIGSVTDSNGNTRTYSTTNGSNSTQVTIKHGSTTAYTYTATYDGNMSTLTRTDGAGTVLSTATYSDSHDPYRPSSVTDANHHTTSYIWDQFGNLHQMTTPRGVITNYTWAFPGSVTGYPVNSVQQANTPVLGELIQVQESYVSGSTTYYKTPTTYTYYDSASGGSANSGLVKTITNPLPGYSLPAGSSGPGSTVTTTFTYDGLGNMTQMVTPGNGTVSSITTTMTYASGTSDAINQPLIITDNLGHATDFTYDAQGNRTSMTDALVNTTYFGDTTKHNGYNIANQPILTTYPATGQQGSGNAQMMTSYLYPDGPETAIKNYDESGVKIRETDDTYGSEGEPLSVTGSTEPVYYTYDPLYRLSTLTDGSGHAASPVKSTSYFYNTAGYLSQVAYPGAAATTPAAPLTAGSSDTMSFTSYDGVGNLKTRVDGRNITTNYTYDTQNTLTDVQYPASASLNVHYDYDGFERKIGMADSVSGDTTTMPVTDGVTYVYDDDDNFTAVATSYDSAPEMALPAWTISYTYNPNGSRAGMELANSPGSSHLFTTYTYDGVGRMTGLTNPYGETTAWTYLNNNWLASQSDANGAATAYSYNARGLMTELFSQVTVSGTTSTLCQFGGSTQSTAMVYDGVGNRTSMTASGFPAGTGTLNGTVNYTYDGRSQLTQEVTSRTYSSPHTNPYQYDGVTSGTTTGAGNGTNIANTSFTFGSNGDNQLASGIGTYGYDGNGNPTTYKGVTLTFDPENRMTAYNVPASGAPAMTAGYTGDGLRAWKQNAAGARTYYFYDGTDAIGEVNNTDRLITYVTFGSNGLISRNKGTNLPFTPTTRRALFPHATLSSTRKPHDRLQQRRLA